MDNRPDLPTRRRVLLGAAAFGTALLTSRSLFADTFSPTPRLTEGPFYPDHLPLDQDNDLIVIKDSATPADGEITHLTGRILDTQGHPVRSATIEIWQCDAHGVYLNSQDSGRRKNQQDQHFQGYGRFETNKEGEYRFRTIKPVAYSGRPAPHIHFIVSKGGRHVLTSQLFIAGHQNNARDGVFAGLRNADDRKLVQTDFKPVPNSKTGELAANFNIVIGRTPDERDFDPEHR